MKFVALGAAALVALLGSAPVQDAAPEETLWMPEGYRLLTLEERQSLPAEELKAIGTRNAELLREAVSAMTPSERAELGQALARYAEAAERPNTEKQFITMTQMMLLSRGVEEKILSDRSVVERRFAELLRAQEATGGFPPEREPVEKESLTIEERIGKDDARQLYLRILRPLRARPWNREARFVFRKIVRGDSYPRPQKTTLYDAALVFVVNREKENPKEGAWDSLEGVLRLSMRGEIDEARRLFGIAVAKNAHDIESHLCPLLIAAADGDTAEFERHLPRARAEWSKPGALESVLWDQVGMLPNDARERAQKMLGERFKKARPADWDARTEIVASALKRGELRQVEQETASLLALPPATLPEPHRTELRALALRAAAGAGRCDEVLGQVASLETAARAAYPGGRYIEDLPPPKSPAAARQLRAELAEFRATVAKVETSLRDGSYAQAPALSEVPAEQRRAGIEAFLAEAREELAEMEAIVGHRDDAGAAAEWTRRDLQAWRERRGFSDNVRYDEADHATRLTIDVRSAAGKCLLAAGRPAEAAVVLAPCVGSGPNYHGACGDPILEAGKALVAQGRYRDAAVAYAAAAPVENFSTPADDLYRQIEAGAPGTVRKFQPTPTPTPRFTPTPFVPPEP